MYAIIISGVVFSLIILYFRSHLKSFLKKMSLQIARYFVYPQLVRRHQYLDPWSPGEIILHVLYIAINAFCIGFRASSFRKAGLRAANLSLINMTPLFIDPDLSFLADIFWFSLSTFKCLHQSAAVMSILLLLLHVLVSVASRESFSLSVDKNMWRVIVSSCSFFYA